MPLTRLPSTARIYAYCLDHLDDEGYVRPLQQDIAQALGLSRSTVWVAVQRLRAEGRLRHVGHRWEQVIREVFDGNHLSSAVGTPQTRTV